MPATNDIYGLLRAYAHKQNSPIVLFAEFCDYMQKYARHYVEELPDLIVYLENPQSPLMTVLDDLAIQKKVLVYINDSGKKSISLPFFFIDKLVTRYKEIRENPAIPFPLDKEIPKTFPEEFQIQIILPEDLFALLDMNKPEDLILYRLVFQKELPSIMYPGNMAIGIIIEIALAKIRYFFRKDESKDYFAKKLAMSNPGKELSARSFMNQLLTKTSEVINSMKNGGEDFYFFSQIGMFIKQDFEKVKDKTAEDVSLIQSVHLMEFANSYYKNKIQQKLQTETALKNLELAMQKPPYYFNLDAISRFVDSHGIPLLGQFTEEDLSQFLQEKTTSGSMDNLPDLLTFKLHTGEHYYIYKDKVLQLILRLCTDARETLRSSIVSEWQSLLERFDTESAMKDQREFEKKLAIKTQKESPVLYTLLNAGFLSLIVYETQAVPETIAVKTKLISNGRLIPYSELLLLNRSELLTDAKIRLPFWYTIPILSVFFAFFFRSKKQTPKKEIPVKKTVMQAAESSDSKPREQKSRKDEIRGAAAQVEKDLVPPNSTLERELKSFENQWNRNIDKKKQAILTEDVNTLVRDYLRTILRTLRGSNFNTERVRNLAQTLVNTPSLVKIRDRDAISMYIQLYLLKLVKSI